MSNNKFLLRNKENADLNQYWYSLNTIEAVLKEILIQCQQQFGTSPTELKIGFLSTPSIYFSLLENHPEWESCCYLFDLDKKWSRLKQFWMYDFNQPTQNIPKEWAQQFSLLVIDPPFITESVWKLYKETVQYLQKPNVKIIASTTVENESLMKELFVATPVTFQPSIPHLVYQYNFYCNFEPTILSTKNPEIPE